MRMPAETAFVNTGVYFASQSCTCGRAAPSLHLAASPCVGIQFRYNPAKASVGTWQQERMPTAALGVSQAKVPYIHAYSHLGSHLSYPVCVGHTQRCELLADWKTPATLKDLRLDSQCT